MEYFEIIVRNAGGAAEALTGRLRDLGAEGFFEQEECMTAYFREGRTAEEICREVEGFRDVLRSSGLDAGFTIETQTLPDQDWNETWKQSFAPIDVGERLTVIPSWLSPDTDRIPVIIDPGTVFGTGHHVTTRTCLVLLEKYARLCAGQRFFDIGTGTGILAVAAARLGFRTVVAADTDPVAVGNARDNAALNGITDMDVHEGDIRAVQGTFDLITANLLSEILIQIAPEIASRLNPGGFAILSGMLDGQEDGVLAAMEGAGLALREKAAGENWISLVVAPCIS